MRRRRAGLFVLIWALSSTPAWAQDGDADTAEEHRGVRGHVDRMRQWTRDTKLLERLSGEIDGWYPRMGGITRGSGFSGGPGLRGSVFGNRLYLDASAAISTKGYTAFDARARWFEALDRRVELWTEFRFEDFPQEDFFGTGMNSSPQTRTSYDFDSADIRVRGVVKPRPWLRLSAAVGYMRPDIGTGTDANYPSIEQLFTDADAPGLIDQPKFLHTTFAGEIDYRDTQGNTSNGGLHRISFGLWNDVTLDAFDFRRVDAHAVQFVPITPDRKHVISGRAGASYVNNSTGDRVPFYFLAYVGGMDTIRSYREFRFKDENALWLSAEYKWRPRSFLSVSVFADAGETRADWQDVDLKQMRTGYGFGVGLHSSEQTILRLDLGTGGGEGWQFFIKVRPSF
jgi:hypothetical protein